ncbi:VanZ family protein [Clostridium tetanomorphum]|uniref:VanZ family protein n=1 Tax=Clostridium tetanomorphum TaxID=1553 RepID=UPI001F4C30F8|nr:VanZ family protein [Clostridium tetanomorphum]NRZ98501.1 glycopeptide antibiotics resistance protein [Clostridium tetanomorphum]
MENYFIPIKYAFITFPFIALLFIVPFAIYQYRKHGYINKFRVFILYSFLLFLITSYYLVILPLPSTRDILSIQKPDTKHYQLMPFNFIFDILKETTINFRDPLSYINILKERAFLQAAFNGILLLPLGIYLRYYFKKTLKQTLLITFLFSLFFELTQLTGLYGIYNAPYRIFDVDDLILNTFGGYIGYLIAPLFTFFLPDASKLDENINLKEYRVSYFRRIISFSIDWLIMGIFINKNRILSETIWLFVYFILIPYLINGKTLGKWILRIKVSGIGKKLTFKEIFIRYIILWSVWNK